MPRRYLKPYGTLGIGDMKNVALARALDPGGTGGVSDTGVLLRIYRTPSTLSLVSGQGTPIVLRSGLSKQSVGRTLRHAWHSAGMVTNVLKDIIVAPMRTWQFWAGLGAFGIGFALGHYWGATSSTFIGKWMGQAGAAYVGYRTGQYAAGAAVSALLGTSTNWGRVLGFALAGAGLAWGISAGISAGYVGTWQPPFDMLNRPPGGGFSSPQYMHFLFN